MLIQDIVPPQQLVVLHEIFLEVPASNQPAAASDKTSRTGKAKKPHTTKVKVH